MTTEEARAKGLELALSLNIEPPHLYRLADDFALFIMRGEYTLGQEEEAEIRMGPAAALNEIQIEIIRAVDRLGPPFSTAEGGETDQAAMVTADQIQSFGDVLPTFTVWTARNWMRDVARFGLLEGDFAMGFRLTERGRLAADEIREIMG